MNRFGYDIVRWIACGVVICGCASMVLGVEFAGGTGEPNDPYRIATAEQLTSIGSDADLLDRHYVLIADIDLDPNLPGGHIFDGAPIAPARIRWAHIIYVDCDPFTGSFDGNGRTIRNLTVHAKEEVDAYVGLFGCVEGRVRNVRLEGVNISGGWQVGGLTGCNQGTIAACSVLGVVTGREWVGTVAGWNEGLVSSCHAAGAVSADDVVGGLVGLHQAGTVAFSYSIAQVSGNHGVGGLIGASGRGTVYLSYWDVDVSRVHFSAGGRGKHTGQMRDRDLYRGWGYPGTWVLADGAGYPRLQWESTDGQPIVDAPCAYGGGTGERDAPFEIWSAEQLLSLGYCPGDYNDCFVLMADIDMGETDPNLIVPIGTARWPFAGQFDGNGYVISNLVCSLETQSCVGLFGYVQAGARPRNHVYGYYPGIVRNVHLVDVFVRGGNFTGGLAGINYGHISACIVTGAVVGLDRTGGLVGDNERQVTDCHYSGEVDGNDCTGGLCGYNRSSVGTVSCSATGTVRGIDKVGGLVGMNGSGELTSCYAQGRVTGTSNVGGFVGYNGGRVRDCYSASTVTGQTRLGGLVGSNWEDIERCTCTGEVLGDDTIGGLVGYNYDTITSCYTTASVAGHSAVGGLIGHNQRATAMYCYAAGAISGDGNDVGGLVGRDYYQGEFLLCYWDTDVTGCTKSQGGFARSTERMRQARTFRGWRSSDWTIQEGADYPRLAWEQKPGEALPSAVAVYGGGTGDPNDPYQIWTAQQFADIAHEPRDFARCFVLMADIDMAQINPDEIIPIGCAAAPFLGLFDGNGHTIFNFQCVYPGSPCMGVVGVLGGIDYSFQKPANVIAVITDLHVANARIVGGSNTGGIAGISAGRIVDSSVTGRIEGGDYTGGILGSNSGEVQGLSCDVVVHGGNYVGGLAGYSKVAIASSSSRGVVHGRDRVGGLVGYQSGPLTACSSACEVDASGIKAGGLVGDCEGDATDCSATGRVSGSGSIGGLIGASTGGLRRCHATGAVVADGNAVGGLLGYSYSYTWSGGITVIACQAAGPVRGRRYVGGLVGYCAAATVSQCCSRSDVAGRDYVGGLIGLALQPVDSSYARGSATGRYCVGGLIGQNWQAVAKCYSTGRVSGDQSSDSYYVRGLLGCPSSRQIDSCLWDVESSHETQAAWSGVTGKTTAQMQTAATFLAAGWDFENIWMICGGQDYPRLQWEGVECR